jgi:hypothetical protein
LPPFEIWVPIAIVKAMANGEDVSKDIISINIPPLDYAIVYRFMYAFGNHLRVAGAEWHLSTQDLRVATTFE